MHPTQFLDIPYNEIVVMMRFFGVQEVMNLQQTCRRLRKAASEPDLVKHFISKDFPNNNNNNNTFPNNNNNNNTWEAYKSLYKERHAQLGFDLYEGAKAGNIKQCQQLLEEGAPINWRNQSMRKETSLLVACKNSHKVVVQFLLQKGANPNLLDNSHYSALQVAAYNGFNGIVTELLKAGAEVNQEDLGSSQPLHFAADRGHDEVVANLLGAGADKTLLDPLGKTAYDYACSSHHRSCIELLR